MESQSTTPARIQSDGERRPVTLVWIDAREATIVRWRDGSATIERIASDVPPHHRDTPHRRHDDTHYRAPGGPVEGGESRRLEHLSRFIAVVCGRLPAEDGLMILGPGTVRDDLERDIRADDRLHRRSREVHAASADRMTERQLIAKVRTFAGDPPRRQARQTAGHAPISRGAGRRRADIADEASGWDGSDDPD